MDFNERLLKENQGLRATVNTYREQNRLLRKLIEECIPFAATRIQAQNRLYASRKNRPYVGEQERRFWETYIDNNKRVIKELEKIMTTYNTIFK